MINEFVFLLYILCVGTAAYIATRMGSEALVALMSVQAILANLFVVEQITLLTFTATASDALGVGTAISLNLLQEFYGPACAKKAIWISFFCAILYSLLTILQLSYLPAPSDCMYQHFDALLRPMPRIMIASLISYLTVQHIDYYLFGFLKKLFHARHFAVRNFISAAVTQLLDTILFAVIGLYGVMPHLGEIIIVSYLIKLVVILCIAPALVLLKK